MSHEVMAANPEGLLSAISRFLPPRAAAGHVLEAQTRAIAAAVNTLARRLLKQAPRSSQRVVSCAMVFPVRSRYRGAPE